MYQKKDNRARISGHFHQAQIDGYHLRDTELQQAHDKLVVLVTERTRNLRAEIAKRQRAELRQVLSQFHSVQRSAKKYPLKTSTVDE